MTSTLSAFPFIGEQSFGTPGAFNSPLSIISANIAAINADVGAVSGVTITPPSGNTITIASNLSVTGQLQAGPIYATGPVRVDVPSGQTNYLYLSDVSNLRSDYIIGSQVGGTADGLNIWDDSGQTMIVSFSKQSVRFYQNVVGPVFDIGGSLTGTLNAATFGTGVNSIETRIQAAINAASLGSIPRVYVPANMYPYSASSISFIDSVQMVREGGNWSVYDVKAYGASGDSLHDDRAAIQAAFNGALAVGGERVDIPTGTYLIGSTLTIPAGSHGLYVSGIARTSALNLTAATLRATFNGPLLVLTGTASNNHDTTDITISDLRLDGAERTYNGPGLTAQFISTSLFERVTLRGFNGNGLRLVECWDIGFQNCEFQNNGSAASASPAVVLENGSAGNNDHISFLKTRWEGSYWNELDDTKPFATQATIVGLIDDCKFHGVTSPSGHTGKANINILGRFWIINNTTLEQFNCASVISVGNNSNLIANCHFYNGQTGPTRIIDIAAAGGSTNVWNCRLDVPSGSTGVRLASGANVVHLMGTCWSGAGADVQNDGASNVVRIDSISGVHQVVDGWYMDNVPINQSNVELTRAAGRFRTIRNGNVTGLVVTSTETRSAGTLTVGAWKNTGLAGAAGASLAFTTTLDAGHTSKQTITQSDQLGTFNGGDELFVTVSTTADWAPTTADIRVALELIERI